MDAISIEKPLPPTNEVYVVQEMTTAESLILFQSHSISTENTDAVVIETVFEDDKLWTLKKMISMSCLFV